MMVIRNENTVFCDIDGTLILNRKETDGVDYAQVSIKDPLGEGYLNFNVHRPMVRLVREESHRGSYVVAWSRGGYEWAESVIKALKLEDCVQLILSKPLVYFDDVPIQDWLPYRVFLDPTVPYKRD